MNPFTLLRCPSFSLSGRAPRAVAERSITATELLREFATNKVASSGLRAIASGLFPIGPCSASLVLILSTTLSDRVSMTQTLSAPELTTYSRERAEFSVMAVGWLSTGIRITDFFVLPGSTTATALALQQDT